MKSRGSVVSALVFLALLQPISALGAPRAPAVSSRGGGYVPRPWPLSPHGPILPRTGALWGAHIGIDPAWTGSDRRLAWAAVEAASERKLVVDREYYFFDDTYPTVDDYWSRDQGRTLYLSMTAYNADASINKWADIAAGLYDATLHEHAAAIKAFGAPIFFAFHHEPNKNNGQDPGTPADFIAAWQHIHDLFIADGVTNVSWVLTLMAWTYKKNAAEQWYPGDAYVDELAADGYNWYGCHSPSGPWTEVQEIFQTFYDYGVSKHKPMIVAEWGTGEDPADPNRKANWFTNSLADFRLWPQIKVVSYYDSSKVQTCFRWVNTSPESQAAFTAEGLDPWFNPTPMVTFTSGPPDPTPLRTATFTWTTGVDQGVSFSCSLDGAPSTSCSSGKSYSKLPTGATHSVSVVAIDSKGRLGNPSTWTWTITGPVTTITAGPANPTLAQSATFTYQGDQAGYTFTCSLDGAAGTPCASPTTYPGPLSVGAHSFSVFATDGDGDAGLPATWAWTIASVGAGVDVADFSFSPPAVDDAAGDAVLWSFSGPSDHTVTDATGMGLFDSGPLGPGSTYFFQFVAAGFYAYQCTIHPTLMSGTVSVPMSIEPTSGTVTTVFTLTWATTEAPAGFGYDVQILRPGATKWVSWGATKTSPTGEFTPDSGAGTYEFRARLTNQSTGRAAAYSKAFAITVTD